MRLYFVRHGIAEDFADSDFQRELTKRGRRRIYRAAAVIERLGIQPVKIFTSPRARSLQTADIMAEALGMRATVTDAVNFGFDLADVGRLIKPLRGNDEVMFVGHNPDMSLLVNALTGSDVAMKKGGLARIDIYGREAQNGELVWLIAPKVFDALHAKKTPLGSMAGGGKSILPDKLALADSPMQELIRRRWSPVGFDPERQISGADLRSILEAARWAASSYNLQPWRFIVAPKSSGQEFERMLSALKEGNQIWARHASVLMIAAAHRYQSPGVINRHAEHDLGQAIAQMVLQALDLGIYAHQMAGFYPDKARELYGIPPEYDAVTAIAFGYRGADLRHLGQAQREREAAGRQRQAMSEMAFSGAWAGGASFLERDGEDS